jgi:DNA-binding response OmpR family regulator
MEPIVSKGKVLIIDDEIDLCHLLKGFFLRRNYEVYLAHTLDQGLAFLESLHPDMLFMDNNLPDGTGWTEAPRLASTYPNMQINLISAFHPARPDMPAFANCRVLEKPISLADLDRGLQASLS